MSARELYQRRMRAARIIARNVERTEGTEDTDITRWIILVVMVTGWAWLLSEMMGRLMR